MSKTRVVIFTENNARILVNPLNVERFKEMPNAVVNPDLQHVKNIPPHFWKLTESGNIVPMSDEEKKAKSIGLTPARMKNVIELPARVVNQVKLVEVPTKLSPVSEVAMRLGYFLLGSLITTIVLLEVLK